MFDQNIFIASSLAILGGCCQVLAVLILAYPEYHKGKGNAISKTLEKLLVPLNILFQVIVGIVNTASTWFGPVSIVMPMRVSSQLLFNMLFFASLGIEEFTKDVRVGTFIVVTAAFILPVVGPTVQQDQDVMILLEHWTSEAWSIFLLFLMVVSGIFCIQFLATKSQGVGVVRHRHKTIILLTARVSSAVISTSVSKLLVVTSGYTLAYSLVGYVFCSIIISTVAILQATEVDQSFFVPATACGIQFVNAITGLIIWQDWKVVQSWSGYALVMLQIVLGVYLIASIEEYGNSSDSDFALTQSFTIRAAQDISQRTLAVEINRNDLLLGDPMMTSLAGGNLSAMLHGYHPSSNQSMGEEGSPLRMNRRAVFHKYSSVESAGSSCETDEAQETELLSEGLSIERDSEFMSYGTADSRFDAAVPPKKKTKKPGLMKYFKKTVESQ